MMLINGGAFFYNPANDALRVKISPEKGEYREWLTYDFTEKNKDNTTLALWWEDLRVPIRIAITNVHDVYLDQFRKDLSSNKMMYWYNWQEAAQYCADNKVALEQGLEWAEKAINQSWVGKANFSTYRTKAALLRALNKNSEAESTMDFAIKHTAGMFELHNYGRELLAAEKYEEALKVFELNANRHPKHWVTSLGMARAYAGLGDGKKALKYANKAQKSIPDNELGVRKYAVSLLIDQLNKKEKSIVFLAPGLKQVY